jgi:hypothetical protein
MCDEPQSQSSKSSIVVSLECEKTHAETAKKHSSESVLGTQNQAISFTLKPNR